MYGDILVPDKTATPGQVPRHMNGDWIETGIVELVGPEKISRGHRAISGSLHPRENVDQNSRPCMTHDSVPYGSGGSAADTFVADVFDCGTCTDSAPCKSGAESFVESNHDVKQSAANTVQTSTAITVHTNGMRVRARSTCNIASVTNASSCCGRIEMRK